MGGHTPLWNAWACSTHKLITWGLFLPSSILRPNSSNTWGQTWLGLLQPQHPGCSAGWQTRLRNAWGISTQLTPQHPATMPFAVGVHEALERFGNFYSHIANLHIGPAHKRDAAHRLRTQFWPLTTPWNAWGFSPTCRNSSTLPDLSQVERPFS